MSVTLTATLRPAGLRICWVPKPGAPARCCTLKDPDHEGDHLHEYSGVSWPRQRGDEQ